MNEVGETEHKVIHFGCWGGRLGHYFHDANGRVLGLYPKEVGLPWDRVDDWRESIGRWLEAGFTMDDLVGFIPRAMTQRISKPGPNPRWKYFCGIVWGTLNDLQTRSAEIVRRDYS